jgi:DNA-binding IscR family transcriptional regulator
MLHILIHMDRHSKRMTSETIAQMLGTNAVVVRRTMAGLKKQGYVGSENGHGGGWKLTRDLADISLLDVYLAIGSPPLFAIGPSSENPTCLVEQAVDAALDETMRNAELLLRARFAEVTIANLASDLDERYAALQSSSEICATKV